MASILTFCLAFYLASILKFCLAFYLTYVLTFLLHSVLHFLWHVFVFRAQPHPELAYRGEDPFMSTVKSRDPHAVREKT